MVSVVPFILTLALAFLLGSIPSGILIGRLFYGIDIREVGSGNIGTTNAYAMNVNPLSIAAHQAAYANGCLHDCFFVVSHQFLG